MGICAKNAARILALTSAAVLLFAVAAQTGRSAPAKSVLYAAVGPELAEYDLDTSAPALIKHGTVTLPANVQEAWPHPSKNILYVAWSNGGASYGPPDGSAGAHGDHHGITAFQIDPATGALKQIGQPEPLPSRPVFITVDRNGTHVIAAYNDPSGLTVHRILPDGSIGEQVPPAAPLDFGIYGHQVRVDPSNNAVILVTRGNGPAAQKAEDPGAIKIYSYKNGLLANLMSVAPNGGFNYQVRHLDFHPSGKWVYVTLERQNLLHVYRRMPDGSLSTTPSFVKTTLTQANVGRSGQAPSSIHVSPDGRFVYVANRASSTTNLDGKRVFAGGENSIAVFSINQETGEPTLIQSVDTQGFSPRTFSINASGRFLVVANQSPMQVRRDDSVATVPASLSLFRIQSDGKLAFARKYDVETAPGKNLFWAGFIALH
jgi:6-phosphogluconolactonase (cycloisomerase 2 family)